MLLEVLILPFFAAALTAAQFASGVDLVEVYATVTDQHGTPAAGLTARDFKVFDEGVPQPVAAFASGDVPLALAVAVDRSFSMTSRHLDRLGLAKAAAHTLIASLRPSDLVTVIAVGSEIDLVAPLSSDRDAAARAVASLTPWGTTPLYDATLAALDTLASAHGRRALVLFSDGDDRGSTTSAADLVDGARRRDVLVYPIAVGATRPPVFVELATATGGRSYAAASPRALDDAALEIARELRSQYLLGYPAPRGAAAGPRWHAIEVQVTQPGLRVRARDGYYAR